MADPRCILEPLTLAENLELAHSLREQHERWMRTEWVEGSTGATLYLIAAEAIEALVAQIRAGQ